MKGRPLTREADVIAPVSERGRLVAVRVGLIQFAGKADKSANIARAVELVNRASKQGAHIVCLQELATTIYFPFEDDQRYFEWAEPIPGPTTDYFANVARDRGTDLILPLFETSAAHEHFSSAVLIDSSGDVKEVYRRSSIPAVRSSGSEELSHERSYFQSGSANFTVCQTQAGASLGVLISSDRHYPEHFRLLALGGAHLIVVPSTGQPADEDSWLFELQAAAFNNSCWVAAANRVGLDERGSATSGLDAALCSTPGVMSLLVRASRMTTSFWSTSTSHLPMK
jgi:predicted amidohydrolase